MKHGIYLSEDGNVVGEGGQVVNIGIARIVFDPETYALRIVLDDGREFFTGSLRGEKGEQGDGYNPDVIQGLKDYSDAGIDAVQFDMQASVGVLINALRQLRWDLPQCEEGSVTLTNSLEFPFNNSQTSVALAANQADINYVVIASVDSADGNAGEVVVSDKQINGFKLAYTGSAKTAVVKYIVIGGIVK